MANKKNRQIKLKKIYFKTWKKYEKTEKGI